MIEPQTWKHKDFLNEIHKVLHEYTIWIKYMLSEHFAQKVKHIFHLTEINLTIVNQKDNFSFMAN